MKINISDDVAERLKKRINNTNFKNIDEYIDFILKKVLANLEDNKMSNQDEEKVKERLRNLGYLD